VLKAFANSRRPGYHARSKTFAVMAVVCLALLAMLTVAQVTHTHQGTTDTDHCALCVVLHTAIPVAAAAALVLTVQISTPVPVLKTRSVVRVWHVQLFNRPPPAGCMASGGSF